MRILHIIQRYPPSIGGSEQWCQCIARYSASKGFDVRVLTLKVYNEEEYWHEPPLDNCRLRFGKIEYDNGVKIIRCKRTKIHSIVHQIFKLLFDKILGVYFYGPHSIEMYLRMIKEVSFADIVHLHTVPHPHNLFGLFVAKLFRRKVVITPHFHPNHPFYERKVNYWLMKKCNTVFTVSAYERNHLLNRISDPGKLVVTGNAICPDDYKAQDLEEYKSQLFKEYNIAPKHKIITFIGRKIEYKGVDTLIEAVKQLNGSFNIKLFLTGPDFPWFKELYSKLTKEEKKHIIDLGISTHKDKVNLLHLSDALVLPSQFEAFGIVFLEAWICETPVIGTNNGAMPAVIGDEGLTSSYGNAEDLKRKIELILSDTELSRKMSMNGRKKVLNNYTNSHIGNRVIESYSSLNGK